MHALGQGLSLVEWKVPFLVLDTLFLSFFLLEIALRLFAFGGRYLRSAINVVDALAIVISFTFTMIEVTGALRPLMALASQASAKARDSYEK